MKKTALLAVFALSFSSFGGELEERMLKLENKIMELERRLENLERTNSVTKPVQTPRKISVLKEDLPPIQYTLIQKKFHKAEDKLIERDDKIQFIFNFTNNLSKQVDMVYGEMVIYDKYGKEVVKKSVKVYKPLDFFSSNKIKPGETFRRTIEIAYDENNPSLRYLKDVSLSDIKVELKFNKVEFSDGSAEFLD